MSADQVIPRILWTPEVRYRIHKRPQTVPIPSHKIPLQASSSVFLMIHFNIIVPSTHIYINTNK